MEKFAYCFIIVLLWFNFFTAYNLDNSNAVEYQNSSITQIDEVVSLQVPTSEYVPNSNAKDRSEDYW
ncbi:MAG: hypothetical protein ABIP78_10135, partial [Pyrinomonadaceae bacterium]